MPGLIAARVGCQAVEKQHIEPELAETKQVLEEDPGVSTAKRLLGQRARDADLTSQALGSDKASRGATKSWFDKLARLLEGPSDRIATGACTEVTSPSVDCDIAGRFASRLPARAAP
jgi:hypothetical protein